jgi:hypothetical protein
MRAENGSTQASEVRVMRVINFNHAPRIDTSSDGLSVNLDFLFGPNNGERKKRAQLHIVLDGIFIIFLDVVGEVVDGDVIVFNVLHDLRNWIGSVKPSPWDQDLHAF